MNSARTKGLDEKFCHECGEAIRDKAEICPECGVRQAPHSKHYPSRNKTVAALLALLLGFAGVHKFYLGRLWSGILYLLFAWTLIPFFAAYIESIRLFLMTEEEFAAAYPGSGRL